MSDFTPEQVERAAKVFVRFPRGVRMYWDPLSDLSIEERRKLARVVLSAAGAPEKVAPVQIGSGLTDVIELAKFLDRHEPQLIQEAVYVYQGRCSCGHYSPRLDHSAHVAKELAAYLRGDSR